MAVDVDRFDAIRRAWINNRRGWSTIQDRRQNRLDVTIRRRQRNITGAVPDPHDDVTIPPIWLRAPKSPAAQIEWATVNICAVLAPLGWFAGWVVSRAITRLIPGTLRAYPIPALFAASTFLWLLTIGFYNQGDNIFKSIVNAWLPAQIAATPLVAGVYGVLDGWLAINGSTSWWPLTPAKTRMSADEADEIIGSYDLTGPGIVEAAPLVDDTQSRP